MPIIPSWGRDIDLESVLLLLSGAYDSSAATFHAALSAVSGHLLPISGYLFSLCTAAALLGVGTHWLVRHFKLDLRHRALRFNNEWYYLLTGEILQFAEMPDDSTEIDGVYLSAVVCHGDQAYLYRGLVADFSFGRHGELDKIFLRMAHRRHITDDRSPHPETSPASNDFPDDRYYDIRGDLFLLRYSEISTLNLDYFELSEVTDAHAAAPL